MDKFRAQPILDAKSHEMCAIELLSRHQLTFHDTKAMAEHDLAVLDHAAHIASNSNLRVHVNVECTTLVAVPVRAFIASIRPGVVVELVERNEIFESLDMLNWVREIAFQVRRKGGLVALDDVTPTNIEKGLIREINPEIIKVDSRNALECIRYLSKKARIVAERIEEALQADLARQLGAHELQGFWCDKKVREAQKKTEGLEVVPVWAWAPA